MPASFAALATPGQTRPVWLKNAWLKNAWLKNAWLKHAWLKNTARVAFLLLFMKGAVWVGASWLTLRGFHGL